MGDMSELRALLIIVPLIASTIALIVYMPSEFYEHELLEQEFPDLDYNDILSWNQTYIMNITGYPGYFDTSFDLNGYEFVFIADNGFTGHIFQLYTRTSWSIFEWDRDYFHWYYGELLLSNQYIGGVKEVYVNTLDNYQEVPLKLNMINGRTAITIYIHYNETAYSGYLDAFENDGLSIVFNANWDDRNTSLNAFQLIGMLFTASLPGIHPVINYLISIPIVTATAYLIFIFALRIVGAVFGGGGA